jgi:hypothetical protein
VPLAVVGLRRTIEKLRAFGTTLHWRDARCARAGRMQMAFGSQALAFATWATEGSQREVRYLFCGLVPPWAASILAHVGEQRGVTVKLEQGAYAESYPPVQRFLLSTTADLLTAATLGVVANLPLVDLQGAAYDGVED